MSPIVNHVQSIRELFNGVAQYYDVVNSRLNASLFEEVVLEIKNFITFLDFSLTLFTSESKHHTFQKMIFIIVQIGVFHCVKTIEMSIAEITSFCG